MEMESRIAGKRGRNGGEAEKRVFFGGFGGGAMYPDTFCLVGINLFGMRWMGMAGPGGWKNGYQES
jgi:hypothetical protein